MAYLTFNTEAEADFRNFQEARKRNFTLPDTVYYWRKIPFDGGWALDVEDGEGLSEEELARTVGTID